MTRELDLLMINDHHLHPGALELFAIPLHVFLRIPQMNKRLRDCQHCWIVERDPKLVLHTFSASKMTMEEALRPLTSSAADPTELVEPPTSTQNFSPSVNHNHNCVADRGSRTYCKHGQVPADQLGRLLSGSSLLRSRLRWANFLEVQQFVSREEKLEQVAERTVLHHPPNLLMRR